jgi:hypothetical protein
MLLPFISQLQDITTKYKKKIGLDLVTVARMVKIMKRSTLDSSDTMYLWIKKYGYKQKKTSLEELLPLSHFRTCGLTFT